MADWTLVACGVVGGLCAIGGYSVAAYWNQRALSSTGADEVLALRCHNCGASLDECMRKPPCCRTEGGKQGCMHGGDYDRMTLEGNATDG